MNSFSKFHLPALFIISVISHFPFILSGIGEPDSARIASVIIDLINHGNKGPLAQYYFTDTISFYVMYLSYMMKFFNYNYSYLPDVMNYTNAIFSTLVIFPAYLLVKRIFENSTVAFCSVLGLIFAPSFFLSSIYGAPHLIAFFFFVLSVYLYVLWIDSKHERWGYLLLGISVLSFTLTLLFKTPYILGGLFYPGIFYLKKIKDKKIMAISLASLVIGFGLFLLIRRLVGGPSGEDTSSAEGFAHFVQFFFATPTFVNLIRQSKPLILVPGILTTIIGVFSIFYFLYKKRYDVLVFFISWAMLTDIFFLLIWNNSRHFMLGIFPLIVTVVLFFHEKAARLTVVLTCLLILGNFIVTPASDSTYFPSGNLFKSRNLLENRNNLYHSKAREIVNMDENKIAVLGYFHNPYVIFELIRSNPSYQAEKIGREDYRITIGNKDYVLFYVDVGELEARVNEILEKHNLDDHVFVSVTNDLTWLKKRGIKTKDIGNIPGYHANATL